MEIRPDVYSQSRSGTLPESDKNEGKLVLSGLLFEIFFYNFFFFTFWIISIIFKSVCISSFLQLGFMSCWQRRKGNQALP